VFPHSQTLRQYGGWFELVMLIACSSLKVATGAVISLNSRITSFSICVKSTLVSIIAPGSIILSKEEYSQVEPDPRIIVFYYN
jgi:hypothetical protein